METTTKRTSTEQRIETLTAKLEKALTRKVRADYAQQEKERAKARQQAQANRKADAHNKIKLGGLVIVAGAQNLDEATLVGLISMAMSSAMVNPQRLEEARQKGLDLMTAKR